MYLKRCRRVYCSGVREKRDIACVGRRKGGTGRGRDNNGTAKEKAQGNNRSSKTSRKGVRVDKEGEPRKTKARGNAASSTA